MKQRGAFKSLSLELMEGADADLLLFRKKEVMELREPALRGSTLGGFGSGVREPMAV